MSVSSPVAVVDIGSNSIKLLVAARATAGRLVELAQRTEETRIGTGITDTPPRLRDDAIERGVASVRLLLADAVRFAPAAVRIVATSAVRDAANRVEFISRLRAVTGHELTVLTGDEEARLIGRGIACDPALHGVPAFHLFDLGGGSLEMLTFRDGRAIQLASLQLGCVRVTEACVADPAHPLGAATIATVRAHVRAAVKASGFIFDLPPPVTAVATGGTVTTLRLLQAAARQIDFAATDSRLRVADLEELAARLCAATLAERRAIPGMPPARADVFPAALVTLTEVARLAHVEAFQHSFYNLRFGLAAELLGIATS
jgi:exopolyphosphatase / guanosine-5'-triphosphate,3'-diphosphate pyrophosphatase